MFEDISERPTTREKAREFASRTLAKIGLQFIESNRSIERESRRFSQFGDIITSDAFVYGALKADGSIEVFGIERFQKDRHYDYVLTTQQERAEVAKETGNEIPDELSFDVTCNDPSRADALYVVESARPVRLDNISSYMGDSGISSESWHVKARRLTFSGTYDPEGELIDFYQSGFFINSVAPSKIRTIGWMNLLNWD